MRVKPDDEVYRVNTVWLGPDSGGQTITFPWVARYSAYAMWLAIFVGILLVEAVTPLTVGLPPVWEISISTLATYALLTVVDHERPIASIWSTLTAELMAPRRTKSRTMAARIRAVRAPERLR